MSQLTIAKTDQPTEMLCPLEEKHIMDNVTSTTDTKFNNPLFILLAKYVYT
jgi:hypothetical protein